MASDIAVIDLSLSTWFLIPAGIVSVIRLIGTQAEVKFATGTASVESTMVSKSAMVVLVGDVLGRAY